MFLQPKNSLFKKLPRDVLASYLLFYQIAIGLYGVRIDHDIPLEQLQFIPE